MSDEKKVIDFNEARTKKETPKEPMEGKGAKIIGSQKIDFNKPMDPKMSMDIRNDEIEKLMEEYAKENTADNLNKLVRQVHFSRMLVPANLNDKAQPIPCFIKNKDGELYMPIYTCKEQIPAEPKSPAILNMPYLSVNTMALKKELNVAGIVINPFSHNLIFKKQLIEKIDAIEKARKIAPKVQKIQMTPQQYAAFERRQYEMVFLPSKLFAEGMAFVDKLCERKEEYLDELFEESYQQKRLYPYLPEEFSVMVMGISDILTIIRVDFPTRDMAQGCCTRAYISWDKEKESARYFGIEAVGPKQTILAEIDAQHKHISHGEAPVEGAELQMIIDLVNAKDMTS